MAALNRRISRHRRHAVEDHPRRSVAVTRGQQSCRHFSGWCSAASALIASGLSSLGRLSAAAPRCFTTRLRQRDPSACRHRQALAASRHEQHSAREGACRKRPKHAHHASSAEPITGQDLRSQECGMRVLPSADESSGCAEPVQELAGRIRATGAGAPPHRAKCLSLSGAAFAGERR